MNEIEKKYFEAFREYVSTSPSVQIKERFGGVRNDFCVCYSEDDDLSEEYSDPQKMIIFDLKHTVSWKKAYQTFSLCLNADPSPIDGYKPDFFIDEPNFCVEGFAIEIDGHEWHEKTKEQAANDRRKDRAYLKNGIRPIRFTGTEVFHDPISCVRETLEIVAKFAESISDYYLLGRDSGEGVAIKKLNNEPYIDFLTPIEQGE